MLLRMALFFLNYPVRISQKSCRATVACALSNNIDEFTKFEGLFYYVHQNGRFQYPVKTARDYQDFNVNRPLLYNAPFERVQDYFVLFQNEDGVLNIH